MPTWNVTSPTHSESVESGGWLDALAAALPQFKLPPGSLGRFVCAMNADGSVDVHEPNANVRLRVTPVAPPPAESPLPSALLGAGPPAEPDPGIDRMAVVFERCAEISAAANPGAASRTALNIVREFVGANAGAVLLATPGGGTSRFVAAFGPRAKEVLNSTLPINNGIVGFIHSFRFGVIIKDARRDARFEAGVDRASGYQTRAVLAVPIHEARGPVYGCLELLNSPTGFTPADLEVVQTVASALGAWLHRAEA